MKICFKSEREIKTFSDKQISRESIASTPILTRNIKRGALEKRKIIQIRNLDLHRESKSTEEGINEEKKKLVSPLFLTDLTDSICSK